MAFQSEFDQRCEDALKKHKQREAFLEHARAMKTLCDEETECFGCPMEDICRNQPEGAMRTDKWVLDGGKTDETRKRFADAARVMRDLCRAEGDSGRCSIAWGHGCPMASICVSIRSVGGDSLRPIYDWRLPGDDA